MRGNLDTGLVLLAAEVLRVRGSVAVAAATLAAAASFSPLRRVQPAATDGSAAYIVCIYPPRGVNAHDRTGQSPAEGRTLPSRGSPVRKMASAGFAMTLSGLAISSRDLPSASTARNAATTPPRIIAPAPRR